MYETHYDDTGKIVVTFGRYKLLEVKANHKTNVERVKSGIPARPHDSMDIIQSPKSWQRKLWEKTESWNNLPGPGSDGYSKAASWRLSNVVRAVVYFRYDIRYAGSIKIAKRLITPVVDVCDRLEDFEETLGNLNRIINEGVDTIHTSGVAARPVFKVILVFRDFSYSAYMGPPDKFMDGLWIDHSYTDRVVIKRRGRNK